MVSTSDDVVALLNAAYVAKEKTPEQKELEGLRATNVKLKKELLRMRRQEQSWRDERFLALEQLRMVTRMFNKLDICTYAVAWDTPNKTAGYIRDYVSKVRAGLALDKTTNDGTV